MESFHWGPQEDGRQTAEKYFFGTPMSEHIDCLSHLIGSLSTPYTCFFSCSLKISSKGVLILHLDIPGTQWGAYRKAK